MSAERRVRWRIAVVLIALVFIAAISVFFYKRRNPVVAQKVVQPAPVVETEITLAGQIRAKNIILVGAPIEGTLEGVDVMNGQDIFEGQLLGRVQNTQLQVAEEQAKLEVERLQTRVNSLEAQLISTRLEASRADADATNARSRFTQAEKNYQRQQMLLREGATPRLTFEKAERDFQTLKTESEAVSEIARQASSKVEVTGQNLDEARKLLSEKQEDLDNVQQQLIGAEVHSPVDGLLIAHRAESGGAVTRDMKDLFQIAVNLGELQLTANVTPQQAAKLHPGQQAMILVAEAGNQPLGGIVESIKDGQLVVNFTSPDPAIRPGLTAQIRLPLEPISSSPQAHH